MDKLSNRIRPDCEAAPFVVKEVKELESRLSAANERIKRMEEAFSYAVNGASAAFDSAGIPPGEFVYRANIVTTRIKRLIEAGDEISKKLIFKADVEVWAKAKEEK